MKTVHTDIALLGGGIMSATVGSLLKQLEPNWDIIICEQLDDVALESSFPWNNAGTGHSALCELNYTPMAKDGRVRTEKAIAINEQFQISRQYWAHMVNSKAFEDSSFIRPVAHMSFVRGSVNSAYLKRRYESLKPHTLFKTIEYTRNPETIAQWAPLVMSGRDSVQPVAASRVAAGADIDFGDLTHKLIRYVTTQGADLRVGTKITDLTRNSDGSWTLTAYQRNGEKYLITAPFVFIGAGGQALKLLQRTGIPEGRGFGGFPVGGQFLSCTDSATVEQHSAKVYGQAAIGAPPMSVPHLDTRFIRGERSLLFGPYASFSTKFLKNGSYTDLFSTLTIHNILPMLSAGKNNIVLTKYLIQEVLKNRRHKDKVLLEYYPQAMPDQWKLVHAGQRVQIIKKSSATRGGTLQFGTELVTATDGSVGALLGASPGASTAVSIMLELLKRCFPLRFGSWIPKIKEMIPTFGTTINDKPHLADEILANTQKALNL